MKIAITYENGKVFQHFGHTEKIKIYQINNGKIVSENIVDTSVCGHEKLVEFLKNNNIDILICGGIGQGAKDALSKANIQLFGGVSGNADDVIEKYLLGQLKYNENVNCEHHHIEGEHHCENHNRCIKNG
ncbi:dinitrogenase iron-molybdenum cofactor biosynthesis [Clostridium sp. CAG:273]|nr:NifB/NifX family molybdenum-iron cluster-binding protein [Clostridia bacterium]CDE84635.1 dinitrogenase iron-molybdenum cofactor biosynthesis [Clostridium sp. CAG:273]